MIKTREDYLFYLNEDRKALGVDFKVSFIKKTYSIDLIIFEFQKTLRKCEYLYSKKNNTLIHKFRKLMVARKFNKLSVLLGYTIPPYTFGPGLRIVHRGTIVVNGQCRIGANCTINVDVNIGTQAGFNDKIPKIGNNVYIGPGVKIFGDIFIADNCAIGANAVVTKSFNENKSIIVGIPAVQKGCVTRNLHLI